MVGAGRKGSKGVGVGEGGARVTGLGERGLLALEGASDVRACA